MARIAAWLVLASESPTPLREVERVCAERGLDGRDRALVRRLAGLVLRRRGTLRAIVRAFTRRPPQRAVALHLHLGLAQLLWLDRVPAHAAVSATVDAARATAGSQAAGFVNAVLRSALRALAPGRSGDPRRDLVDRELHFERAVFRDPEMQPWRWGEEVWSVPALLLERWSERLGRERAFGLAATFLEEPPLSLRVVRGSRTECLRELEALGAEPRAGSHARAILCPAEHTGLVLGSELFGRGRLTVQGETALAAAELIGAREGERILDLCAAPGGKSAVLLETGAALVACDLDPGRLERVRETCTRLDLVARLELVQSDGTRALPPALFDACLIDAPCTNTGVLGARPEARWRFGPAELEGRVALQRRLLCEAAERVRPGGRLVWSTCSLEPEENGELVRAFLAENRDWSLEVEREAFPDRERGPIDGGYAARLARGGDAH